MLPTQNSPLATQLSVDLQIQTALTVNLKTVKQLNQDNSYASLGAVRQV